MDVSKLKPGDNHYMAYVGPPTQYDFMGASQFRLLCTLGLRANHELLDFGCGSLRAGRLFIIFLNEGCYYGVDPNKWLIEEAIRNQVGHDLVLIKKPNFDYNESFSVSKFHTRFDFILAQSIFSHAGADIVNTCLRNFKESLKDDGLIAVTFVERGPDFGGEGWVYPECVSYRPSTIMRFAQDAGLAVVRIPWYHPRQAWYILAKRKNRLPSRAMGRYLQGAVLFEPDFRASWNMKDRLMKFLIDFALRRLPSPIKNQMKRTVYRGSQ
jgi:SAM-dependent methyltransferase